METVGHGAMKVKDGVTLVNLAQIKINGTVDNAILIWHAKNHVSVIIIGNNKHVRT